MWSGSYKIGEVDTKIRSVDSSRQMRLSCNSLVKPYGYIEIYIIYVSPNTS